MSPSRLITALRDISIITPNFSNFIFDKSFPSISAFPDDNSRLTDGVFTGFFESGIWVGYEGGDAVAITVDLGKKRDDLSVFRAECYANVNIGTYMPVAVTYSVSDDNKNFTDIGRVFGVASDQNVYDFPLILSKAASGRYVRFTFEATETKMYLVEEVAVYANTGESDTESLYPDLVFDPAVKNWPNPSTEVVNLIKIFGMNKKEDALKVILLENIE